MSSYDACLITSRGMSLLALLLLATQSNSLMFIVAIMFEPSQWLNSAADLPLLVLPLVMPVALLAAAIVLWVAAPWIAQQMAMPTEDERSGPNETLNAQSLTVIAMVVVGLLLATWGGGQLLAGLLAMFYNISLDWQWYGGPGHGLHDSVEGCVQLLVGVGLIAGRRGLAKAVTRLRTAATD